MRELWGKFIKVDKATFGLERFDYARILINVDINVIFLESMNLLVNGKPINIQVQVEKYVGNEMFSNGLEFGRKNGIESVDVMADECYDKATRGAREVIGPIDNDQQNPVPSLCNNPHLENLQTEENIGNKANYNGQHVLDMLGNDIGSGNLFDVVVDSKKA
ncbi:hypothetical protein QQP08_008956 [Theobroma cacao]|nr:hypothetical protein QQP08_007768 [Theobroma cacao]WRX16469.1 hypothetical protein QQP08_008956 [Theobroma cacao]